MATLQIRDLPDRHWHRLQALASQQAVQRFDPSPGDLIRLDRSR